MNILIAGSNGDIASDLINLFKNTNHNLILVSKSKNKNKIKRSKFLRHDFKKPLIIKSKIDIIVNCVVTHEFSKNKTYNDYYNNILSMKNLIDIYFKNKSKYFINFSTISIYKKKIKIIKRTFQNMMILY